MAKVAILQPNYLPWKGVFDLINKVDHFVFFDDVQYTKRDWRNRNQIKTRTGLQYLTVPVEYQTGQLVKDVIIVENNSWQDKHHKAFIANYSRAPYWHEYKHILDRIYTERIWSNLAELDIFSTKLIAETIGIKAHWHRSSDLGVSGDKSGERIVKICKALSCDYFINGPAAHSFMDPKVFEAANVSLNYMIYSYPEYKQQFGEFKHEVTVLDVLFNCGADTIKMIETGKLNSHTEISSDVKK